MGNDIVLQQPDDAEARGEAALIVKQANEIAIKSTWDYENAGLFLRNIKGVGKRILERLDEPCKKANAAWKAMVKVRDEALAPFDTAEALVKQKMAKYESDMETKRREEQRKLEEKARKEAEERRAKEIADAKKAKDKEAVANLQQAPLDIHAPTLRTPETPKVEGVTHRKVWRVQSVDAAKLPLRYLTPDMKAIEATVRGLGGRHGIPGVVVVEDTITSVRS